MQGAHKSDYPGDRRATLPTRRGSATPIIGTCPPTAAEIHSAPSSGPSGAARGWRRQLSGFLAAYLVRRSRPIYRQLRDTVIAIWLIAVPIFALFPVALPRLAGIGIADTVSHQVAVSLTHRSTIFYNPIAAVPSLHVSFAFAIAIPNLAGQSRLRRRRRPAPRRCSR